MTQKVPASQTVEAVTASGVASAAAKQTGDVVQVVATQTGAVSTGTTIIPRDDTIPQITEGTQVLSQAITPTSASSILQIEVLLHVSNSIVGDIVAALFQDSGASAIAVGDAYCSTAQGVTPVMIRHRMTAGTTSATTFAVRAGPAASATMTVNGAVGGRYFGGVLFSSITITELKA